MPAINLEKYVKEMKHWPVSAIFMEAMQTIEGYEAPDAIGAWTEEPEQIEAVPEDQIIEITPGE